MIGWSADVGKNAALGLPAGERLRDIGDERDRAHLAALRRPEPAVDVVAVPHADRVAGEVDVAPPQREQFPSASR
jgi:hypothetical protein